MHQPSALCGGVALRRDSGVRARVVLHARMTMGTQRWLATDPPIDRSLVEPTAEATLTPDGSCRDLQQQAWRQSGAEYGALRPVCRIRAHPAAPDLIEPIPITDVRQNHLD